MVNFHVLVLIPRHYELRAIVMCKWP